MDWGTIGAALAGCAPLPIAFAFLVSTAQVYAQLARFVVLVPPAARGPLFELLDATAVGQLLNYAAPLRGGDAYKLIRLAPNPEGAEGKGRLTILLAALLVERVADIAALFVMAAWASFPELAAWLGTIVPSGSSWAKIGIGLVVTGLVAALFARRLQKLLGSFLAQVGSSLWSPRFARSFGISLVTWTLDAGTLYWTSRSVGAYALSFRDVMHSVFVLNLGIAMPVTVGNLGVFEAALAFALTRHGVSPAHAIAIAMLEHVAKFAGLFLCILSLRAGWALRRRLRPVA
jgi:uncharacterized membrane protein YbhN (UPF0104 family)